MCTTEEYDKVDLEEFVAESLPMTKKMNELKAFKFMLKGVSYTWSSVLSIHPHITKQVELYHLEWSDMADIHDLASTFKQADLNPPPMQPPGLLPKWALSQTWITQALAIALILCNTDVVSLHKTILAFIVQRANRILWTFLSPCHTLLPRHWPQTFKQTINYGQFCLHGGLVHKTILVYIVQSANPMPSTSLSPCHTLLPRNWPQTFKQTINYRQFCFESYYLSCHLSYPYFTVRSTQYFLRKNASSNCITHSQVGSSFACLWW